MQEVLELGVPATLAGCGAMLAAIGYKLVRFHALKLGVFVLAAAGCLGGSLLSRND